ncbi:MAG: OmpA family protein [Methylococcales bacterium]|nr:OmpA family protein [Methylococcales bacterium]
MSNNLLELINENISEDVISTLSGFLGESPKNTTSALSNAIPSILAGLVHKSTDTQAASTLFTTLKEAQHNGSILNNLTSAFTGGEETSKLLATGSTLLSSLFGTKVEGVANLVAKASGMSKTSTQSLLGLLTPVIFGVIGKTVSTQGISSAAGLTSLLASHGGFLKNFLPAGLSSLLGMTHLPGFESAPPATPVYDVDDNSDGFGKILPWLLLPVILGLGWGLFKYFKLPNLTTPESSLQQTAAPAEPSLPLPEVAPATTTTPEAAVATPAATTPDTATVTPVATTTPESSTPSANTVASVTENVADLFEKTLPSGFAIKASKSGIENKLIAFLEDNSKAIDKNMWFTMNGIVFDSGKATLKPESMVQITNITEILKAFPSVKIKMGGYTDNSGNAKANVTLSGNRATAIKKALVAAGIDATRLDAEGFGSEHPVADNKTKEGRQQNRRIDIKVTAK